MAADFQAAAAGLRILLCPHAPEFRSRCRQGKGNGLRIVRECEGHYGQPIRGEEICGFLNFMHVIYISIDGEPEIGRAASEREHGRTRQD